MNGTVEKNKAGTGNRMLGVVGGDGKVNYCILHTTPIEKASFQQRHEKG